MSEIYGALLKELPPLDPSIPLPSEILLFQFGPNETSKGTFVLDEEGAKSIMASYADQGIELHFDWEHDKRNAAAWFVPEVRADGLYATNVRWVPRAAQELRDKEYRYYSPAFFHDDKKRIIRLLNSSLTNLPATKNQKPLMAKDDGNAEAAPVAVEAVEATTASEDSAGVEVAELAVWSTAFKNDLPDSSFLYIEPGGKKDSDGKTVPRSLRHFPVKDANGKPDILHVRDALSRIPQSNVPADVKARCEAAARRMLGNQKEMNMGMGNIGILIGLKADAADEEVEAALGQMVELKRRVLEKSGKKTVEEAYEWLDEGEKSSASTAARLTALETDRWYAEVDAAVAKWQLTPAEAGSYKKLAAGPERSLARKMIALRPPNKPGAKIETRYEQAPAQRGDFMPAAEREIQEWVAAHPGKSETDAIMTLSMEKPELFPVSEEA